MQSQKFAGTFSVCDALIFSHIKLAKAWPKAWLERERERLHSMEWTRMMIDLRSSRTIMRSRSWSWGWSQSRSSTPVLVSVAKSSELIGSGRSCQIGLVSFGSLRSGRVASHRMHNLMCVEVVLREIYVDFRRFIELLSYWRQLKGDSEFPSVLGSGKWRARSVLGLSMIWACRLGIVPEVRVRNWKEPCQAMIIYIFIHSLIAKV